MTFAELNIPLHEAEENIRESLRVRRDILPRCISYFEDLEPLMSKKKCLGIDCRGCWLEVLRTFYSQDQQKLE